MLNFDNEYFEDEVRSGFYVPSMTKRSWAVELEVLAEIDRICRKHNITYFLDWGSLLGAIRHKGFIPWDDDMDIVMFRAEYDKFYRAAKGELPEGFFITDFESRENCWRFLVNVTSCSRMCFEPDYMDKYYGFPYMAGLDIFIMDNISKDPEEERCWKTIIKFIIEVADHIDTGEFMDVEIDRMICQIENLCQVSLLHSGDIYQRKLQLYKLAKREFAKYDDITTPEMTQLMPHGLYNNYRVPREYYREAVHVPFENIETCVPIGYDNLLRQKYGDYMKIVMEGGDHNYPFYITQKQALGTDLDFVPTYRFSLEHLTKSPVFSGKKKRDRKEIVFLPFKARYFKAFESVYQAACEDENCDVYVIPVPYFYKKYDGSFYDMQYEGDCFSKDVTVTYYEDYDFSRHCPDIIFIQNPYDEFNMAISVPPFFYASNLKNYTEKLIYIPYFKLAEFKKENYRAWYNMQFYCTMPGVVHADLVILQSEEMKKRYVEKLTDFAGEETKKIWEQKIVGCGTPFTEEQETEVIEEVPMEWKPYLYNTQKDIKSILLYYTSLGALADADDRMVSKIRSSLEILKKQCNQIAVVWYVDPNIFSYKNFIADTVYEKLMSIVAQYKDEKWGIYGNRKDEEKFPKFCDAYYGDASSLACEFNSLKKPVMIQNVECQ